MSKVQTRGHVPFSLRQLPQSRGALGTLGVSAVILLWWVAAARIGTGSGQISRLSEPPDVARALVTYVTGGFLRDLVSSLTVFVLSWALGGAAAILVGLLLGRVAVARAMVFPVIEAFRPVSSIAWVPLSIVWFGFGLPSKVFLVALAVFLVVIVYSVSGASNTPEDLERVATMLGMSRLRRLRHLVIGSMMSEALIGLRVALMAGWGTVIVAELVASNTGMGSHLLRSQQAYEIPQVMAAMLCFGAVGYVINSAFEQAERVLLPWRNGARHEH